MAVDEHDPTVNGSPATAAAMALVGSIAAQRCSYIGATENAGTENAGPSSMERQMYRNIVHA